MAALSSAGCSREDSATNAHGKEQAAVSTQPNDSSESPNARSAERASENLPVGGPGDFDAILKKHVDGDYFDYAGLKSNPDDLRQFDSFLNWQAMADVSNMSREDQIAFHINAYNACCIKAIVDHYPVETPKDIPSFFVPAKQPFDMRRPPFSGV